MTSLNIEIYSDLALGAISADAG